MIELADGRLLLTGGSSIEVIDEASWSFGAEPAQPDAYIYDGNSWVPTTPLGHPRGGHRML